MKAISTTALFGSEACGVVTDVSLVWRQSFGEFLFIDQSINLKSNLVNTKY